MGVEKVKLLKKDKRGAVIQIGSVKIIIRKKNSISADHVHKNSETLYLIQGTAKTTIGSKTRVLKSPVKIRIPPNIYHKLTALSDLIILEEK